MFYCTFNIFILVHIAYGQDLIPTASTNIPDGTDFGEQIKLTDAQPSVLWSPTFKRVVQVIAHPGYRIVVSIEDSNMDIDKHEYVTVSSDQDGNNDLLRITYTVSNKPSYLYALNELYARYEGTDASSITLNFTRVGERLTTTTTEVPTTTIILPTADPNVQREFTIYISGKTSEEYRKIKTKNLIKTTLANMANEYCISHSYELVNKITINNIILSKIAGCPNFWPGSETCVTITFAIPALIVENSKKKWTGYQLSTDKLMEMWDSLQEEYLPDDLSEYEVPDTEAWFHWQIYFFSGLVVIFVVTLLLIRHYSMKFTQTTMRRKLSDTTSIISSKRDSVNDLRPHPLQETPPLFENVYPMFNPMKTSYTSPTYTNQGFSDDINEMPIQKKERDIEYADEEDFESGA